MNKARFQASSAIILYPMFNQLEIGEETWIGPFTVIDGSEGLFIGKHCSIASGVHIYTHSTHLLTTKKGPRKKGCVRIGDNVAVGANSVIHYDVEIGSRAVIGALSNVLPHTRIGEDEFWTGNPACFVKKMEKKKNEQSR